MSDNVYVDLSGVSFSLLELDKAELRLLRAFLRYYEKDPDWGEYHNFWQPKVEALYSARGLSRREMVDTTVFLIAQDLGSRLMIKQGWARPTDYRDEILELIRTKFASRREFCKATGLSEDMLSHVLAGRKNLAITTLSDALNRIGYSLRILPNMSAEPHGIGPARPKTRRAS